MSEEFDTREFESKLKVDKNDLDTEWQQNPQLFWRVSNMHARALSDRDSIKVDIGLAEAELYSLFRQKMEDELANEDDKKKGRVTDAAIKSRVESSPQMVKLNKQYLKASERANILLALKEGYQQRSYSLKYLSELYTVNYFTVESGGKVRNDANDKTADRNREAAGRLNREARRERRGD